MSDKKEHINFDNIDLDSLSVEDKIMVARLKGEIGHSDYTKDRHKWLDKIPEEEVDRALLEMTKERKKKQGDQGVNPS
jgi:hypothetical protein